MILYDEQKDRYVLVPNSIIESIKKYSCISESSKEAGGIFIGSYRGTHIEVVSCTTPYADDTRDKYAFNRCDRNHQLKALELWEKSNHTQTYIGEWHTHPEGHPAPSPIDLRSWEKVRRQYQPSPVFFMIGGLVSQWFGCADDAGLCTIKITQD